MINPLALKLGDFVDLSDHQITRLDALCADVRTLDAKTNLIHEGDRPETVFLFLEGWACRYKMLEDGGRQIVAFVLPGDLCDIHVFILEAMDHTIGLLSDARVAVIPRRQMLDMLDECPGIARALWWSGMVDDSVLREWMVNMGRRNAFDRLAHLIAELWLRMKMVSRTVGGSFDLPVTQIDLADALGLTSVHLNRTIQEMRSQGLIETSRRQMHIPDMGRLMAISGFQPNYLHLKRRNAIVGKPE